MRRFDHFAVGVSSGSTLLFSAFEHDGQMWTGHGPRTELTFVRFSEPFHEPPVVHVSLSMWDVSVAANQRADIKATEITCESFVIRFQTWGDTRVARVRADWLAIGPVAHVDQFDAD